MSGETLLCWASVNHGTSVLTGALEALAERGHSIERVLLLVQEGREAPEGLPQHLQIETMALPVADPKALLDGAASALSDENVDIAAI